MANQGILAKGKPGNALAVLYSCPIDKSASTVLHVANDGTGAAIDVAIKDFDQKLTVDGSGAYKLHKGDVITEFNIQVNSPFQSGVFTGGQAITSADGEKTLKFESLLTPAYTEIFVKSIAIRAITVESLTGTYAVGETLTKGSGSDTTTAVVYGVNTSTNIVYIGASTINGSGSEFAAGDSVANTGATASATIASGGVATASNKFVFSTTTAGGTYDLYLVSAGNTLALFSDRAYRFNVADASMGSKDFSLSTTLNGEWGPDGTAGNADDGSEYTTGRTTNGTAGSAGAYVQYDFSANASLQALMYWYEGTTGTAANSSYGGSDSYFSTNTTPTWKDMYVYDVTGTWTTSDSFLFGGVTYTLTAVNAGAHGYVRSYSSTTLYVVKGAESVDFAGSDTFKDCPKVNTATRSTVTVNSVAVATTAVEAENYIIDGVAVGNNAINRTTSLVIGPGEKLLALSATANNVFSLIGFEDASSAFVTRTF